MTTQLPHWATGKKITPVEWNDLVDAINVVAKYATSVGGTIGNAELDSTICGGRTSVTPDSSGVCNVDFGTTVFTSPPAVVVTGNGGNPNVLCTIATSGTPVSTTGFRVRCQDLTNNTAWTGHGPILISWIACTRNGPDGS